MLEPKFCGYSSLGRVRREDRGGARAEAGAGADGHHPAEDGRRASGGDR